MRNLLRSLFLFLGVLALASCGGGGGGGGGTSPQTQTPTPQPMTQPMTPPPPAPPAFPTAAETERAAIFSSEAEYSRHPGLAASRAEFAYARGYTGAGVRVGLNEVGASTIGDRGAGLLFPNFFGDNIAGATRPAEGDPNHNYNGDVDYPLAVVVRTRQGSTNVFSFTRYLLPSGHCEGPLYVRIDAFMEDNNCVQLNWLDMSDMAVPNAMRPRFIIPAGSRLLRGDERTETLYSDLAVIQCSTIPERDAMEMTTSATDCALVVQSYMANVPVGMGTTERQTVTEVSTHGLALSAVLASPRNFIIDADGSRTLVQGLRIASGQNCSPDPGAADPPASDRGCVVDFVGTAYGAQVLFRATFGADSLDTDTAYFAEHNVRVVIYGWAAGGFENADDPMMFDTVPDYEGITNAHRDLIRGHTTDQNTAFLQAHIPEEADKVVHVMGAGNRHQDVAGWDGNSPLLYASMPFFYPELLGRNSQRPLILAVVGLDETPNADGQYPLLERYHRCGVAARWCLAAVADAFTGWRWNVSDNIAQRIRRDADGNPVLDGNGDPIQERVFETLIPAGLQGTSYAAPQVAGALAILLEQFPMMGAPELAWRLLVTADDTGIYANSAIYGHGLLDLEAATRPAGATTIRSASGEASYLQTASALSVPPAFGDALHRAVGSGEIAAFDSLDAPFFAPLTAYFDILTDEPAANPFASFMRSLSAAPPHAAPYELFGGEVLGFQSPLSLAQSFSNFSSTSSTAQDSMPTLHLAAKGSALALRWNLPSKTGRTPIQVSAFMGDPVWQNANPFLNQEEDPASYGFVLQYGMPENISLHAGLLHENDNFLGGRGRGAFGTSRHSDNWFFGVAKRQEIMTDWNLYASAQMGFIRPKQTASVLEFEGDIITSSFNVSLARKNLFEENDEASFSVHQPLRVETGELRLSYAASRNRDGSLIPAEIRAPLSPSRREIQFSLAYAKPISKRLTFKIAASIHHNHAHRPQNQEQLSLLAGIAGRF